MLAEGLLTEPLPFALRVDDHPRGIICGSDNGEESGGSG